MQLRFSIQGEERVVSLQGREVRLGRGRDNTIVLADFSVSRRHAAIRLEDDAWVVYDLESTNGVQLNGESVKRGSIRPGDELKIGVFELRVEGDAAASKSRPAEAVSGISSATIVRPLSEFSSDFGFEPGIAPAEPREPTTAVSEPTYAHKFFGFLTRLARALINTQEVDQVLGRMMDIAFEALPVDRGFILLEEEPGRVVCELARFAQRVEFRPQGAVPVSKTILDTVMKEKVGLLTLDALDDQRLAGGESIRIHGIRAAMCVPLWSEEQIIGFMQVDSPFQSDSFKEQDLDFLIALSNFGAVAVQRIRELRVRSRLERYHSPAVIEEVLREDEAASGGQGVRRLRKAEVTVLFADLVGFTAFSESADLDEVAELLKRYFTGSVEAIFAQGGTLDKFIGDCVMAFFGAPMEQEDHALRGVRAAVQIQSAVDDWNAERRGLDLPEVLCRIALNSGPVVVGEVGSPDLRVDYTVLGNTVNVAARLEESVTNPGEIVVAEATSRLLGDAFELDSLGAVALKGLQQKVSAYRLAREDPAGGS